MESTRAPILVDFALQGGGAHGAFTWGVLDRLLEEPWLQIDGISGTSAGAMNAAVLVDGYADKGADGARAMLENFWRRVSRAALLSPLRRTPLDVLLGRWTLDHSPAFVAMDLMARLFSPYDIGPRANPLRDILTETVDFDRLAQATIKLFVTATNVRTGRGRVFRNSEITPDVLLASACLPTMFQAIEIGGESYWDGGYSGNPTITPLVRECESKDTILVQINPVERPALPRSARDILNRLNEVSKCRAAERAAHDRAAAPSRAVRQFRVRKMGGHAHPPHLQRDDGRARVFLQAQRRVGIPMHAARRGAPRR
jgi:NTE family protein